jgi:plastocyanin
MNPTLPPEVNQVSPNNSSGGFGKWGRNIALVAIAVVLVTGVIVLMHASTTSASTSNTAIVSITSKGLIPQTITVKPGETVVWVNDDSHPHQIAADPYPADNGGPAGLYDPIPITKGESYGFTFTSEGTYTYHDQLHPYTLDGKIIVK